MFHLLGHELVAHPVRMRLSRGHGSDPCWLPRSAAEALVEHLGFESDMRDVAPTKRPCLDFCFLDNPIVVFAQCSLRVSEYKAICTAKLTVTFRYLLQAIVLEI